MCSPSKKPEISIVDYLWRLTTYAALPPAILLSMVYYADCLSSRYPPFLINSFTAHRFLITAATVASKGLMDVFYDVGMYARIGGLRTAELVTLERELLNGLDWRIAPCSEILEAYYHGLVYRSQGYVLELDSRK